MAWRPEGGPEASPPYFFLSYAHSRGVRPRERFEADALVRRFQEDLANAVFEHARHPRATARGGYAADGASGADWRWESELASALASCRTFVALYCTEYFTSQECGKEWTAFADRINHDFVRYNTHSEGFIPVLWLPIRPESLPSAVMQVQYVQPQLGAEYHQHGLRYLMTHRELRDRYLRSVDFFAKRVVAVAETRSPTPAVPPPQYRELHDAFTPPESAASSERPKVRIVVAAPRRGRLPRGCDPEAYGAEAFNWRPYLPEYDGEIAQTAVRVAESLHFAAFVESADRCRELNPAADATAPTILLVDPWAAQQPELQQRLGAFDRRTEQKRWIRLAIPWSRANRDSARQAADLESRLETTLARTRARCRWETPRAVDGLETVDDLIRDLPWVLFAAERHFLALAKTYPPVGLRPGPPRTRPRLRAPGLGTGGVRATAPRNHDEPPKSPEDRP